MNEAHPHAGEGRRRLGGLFLATWIVVLAVAAAVFLAVVVPQARRRVVAEAAEELDQVADLRETALSGWCRDVLADDRTVARFPTASALVADHPSFAPDPRFTSILDDFAAIHDIRTLSVLDRELRVQGSTTRRAALGPEQESFVGAVLAGGRDSLEILRDADGHATLCVVAITPAHDGCALAVYDPEKWIFVLLDPPPLGQRSGEVLLVRSAPGGIAVLSPGLGRRFAPPAFLGTRGRIGKAAALYSGRDQLARGLDDRGRRVFVHVRPVRGQDWSLVLKVDEADVFAIMRDQVRTLAVGTALLLSALTALAFALVWGQRRAHETASVRHRERLAILLDQANEAIGYLSPDGIVRQVNRSAEEYFGVPGGLVGRNVFEVLQWPGTGPGFEEVRSRMERDGRAQFESEALAAGGVRRPVEISLRAVTLDGRTSWVALVRDIGDRKESDARILRLNRLLRTSHAVSVAIHQQADEHSLFASVCRMAVELGGFRIANVSIANPDGSVDLRAVACLPPLSPETIPPLSRPETRDRGPSGLAIRSRASVVVQDIDDARLTEDVRENFRIAGSRSCGACPIRVGGSVRGAFVLFSAEPAAFDSEAMALVEGMAAELGSALGAIEERRTRERVEERLGALFAAGPVGFVAAGPLGQVTHANPEFLRIVGRTPAELSERRIEVPELAGDRGAAWVDTPAPFETELTRPDGTSIPVLMGRMRLHQSEGETLAVVLDMTRLRETAESLRQTQMQLFQAQKMETVGQLAGGIAHDFNNLLTVIHGYAEMLRSSPEVHGEDVGRVDQILRAADRATGLSRQLLAFSRRQVPEPRLVDLAALVQEAGAMLRRIIGSGVQLEVRCERSPGRVLADPGQVEQVLLNLVVNARDAMPGGGRIVLDVADANVGAQRVSAHEEMPPGPYVRLAVSDSGTGIAAEHLVHIFEPFFTTKEVGKGTGLGLSTVAGIVRQAGGFVFVSSDPGHGTTFEILLPRAEAPVPVPAAAGPLAPGPASG